MMPATRCDGTSGWFWPVVLVMAVLWKLPTTTASILPPRGLAAAAFHWSDSATFAPMPCCTASPPGLWEAFCSSAATRSTSMPSTKTLL
jgi:hypothetical protein